MLYFRLELVEKMGKYLIIVISTFLTLGGFTSATIFLVVGRFLPFSGFQLIPAKTPGPINIETREAKKIITPPVIFFINSNEKGVLKNTGHSVEIYFDGNMTANGIIGGVLGFNYYVFQKFRFYWAGSPEGVAASTVNGKNGTPLEVCIYYYNMKYVSFKNAINFRNGVVEVIFRIKVGSKRNPAFDNLATSLKRVQKPESEVELNIADGFLFYVKFPALSKYYVYTSAFVNETTGRQHSCATAILAPLNPNHYISKKQFAETFLSLLNDQGKPLINTAKQEPRGGRPVVKSAGLIKVSNFLKVTTKN